MFKLSASTGCRGCTEWCPLLSTSNTMRMSGNEKDEELGKRGRVPGGGKRADDGGGSLVDGKVDDGRLQV